MSERTLSNMIGYVRRSMPVLLVNDDKEPLGDLHPNGFYSALRTPEDCRRACALHPEGHPAVVTGPTSGLTVLDADGREGAEALDELGRELGPLPPTTMVATRRGMHYWFATATQELPSRIGLKPMLDVKSFGGYVVAPPAQINGARWRFVSGKTPPAPLPASWIKHLRDKPTGKGRVPVGKWTEILTLRKLTEGERNDQLTRLTGHLVAHGLDPDVVYGLMLAVDTTRCAPALGSSDVERIVGSITGRELRKRRSS